MTSQLIGYGRVSTADQNPDGQRDALERAGCDRVFIDTFTGTKLNRPAWTQVREVLRHGDTLVITRLDRLGRSTKDLLEISSWLQAQDVQLMATEQAIDTRTPEGQLFFTLIAAFAQFEHSMIVARTKDGLAAARARGRAGGRKPKITSPQAAGIRRRYESGETVQALADSFNVSRPTIYRALEAQGDAA